MARKTSPVLATGATAAGVIILCVAVGGLLVQENRLLEEHVTNLPAYLNPILRMDFADLKRFNAHVETRLGGRGIFSRPLALDLYAGDELIASWEGKAWFGPTTRIELRNSPSTPGGALLRDRFEVETGIFSSTYEVAWVFPSLDVEGRGFRLAWKGLGLRAAIDKASGLPASVNDVLSDFSFENDKLSVAFKRLRLERTLDELNVSLDGLHVADRMVDIRAGEVRHFNRIIDATGPRTDVASTLSAKKLVVNGVKTFDEAVLKGSWSVSPHQLLETYAEIPTGAAVHPDDWFRPLKAIPQADLVVTNDGHVTDCRGDVAEIDGTASTGRAFCRIDPKTFATRTEAGCAESALPCDASEVASLLREAGFIEKKGLFEGTIRWTPRTVEVNGRSSGEPPRALAEILGITPPVKTDQ